MARSAKPIKERIESLVKRVNGCWEWQGRLTKQGYGQTSTGSRTDNTRATRIAHRVSYETFVGEIPEGLTIDHLCRNRACVNPDHLEAVTIKENVRRGNPLWKQEMARTHCPQGHEYTTSNVYLSGRNKTSRSCKTCMKSRSKARYWASRRMTPSHAH